jgi:hypothetical protein
MTGEEFEAVRWAVHEVRREACEARAHARLARTSAMRSRIDAKRLREKIHRDHHRPADTVGQEGYLIPLGVDTLAAVADLDLLEQLRPSDHLWYTKRGNRRLRRDPISDTRSVTAGIAAPFKRRG